ncbi:MAG: B12-binding domain-containing radical SAM protein [bacterium]|nr:B12-binding domain-containing radical SAM protein [bacterium]
MKVTFIMPSIGRKTDDQKYVRTWQMEPLPIGALSALTPDSVEKEFFDDRFNEIDFDTKTDLVAITVETYTARRSYEISKEFRDRGVKVIMGGFHPTLNSDEVLQYADSIAIGEADDLWVDILKDAENGKLKRRYQAAKRPSLEKVFPDRTIFKGRDYLEVGLVETGRGCPFVCDFCTVCQFYQKSYTPRPIEDVVEEIRKNKYKYYFFVDDNIASNPEHAKKLFTALIPLKIRWLSQGSINMAKDPEMLKLMKKSGCLGVLVGFESLNKETLKNMKKGVNMNIDLDKAVETIHGYGIRIYATFVFGYDDQKIDVFEETYKFAMKHKFFITAFNHIVPFPGSDIYKRLKDEGRLIEEKFWLNHDYTFGDVIFQPKHFTPKDLTDLCFKYRKGYYNWGSIFKRLFSKPNFGKFGDPFAYFLVNYLSRVDVSKRQGLPMGKGKDF